MKYYFILIIMNICLTTNAQIENNKKVLLPKIEKEILVLRKQDQKGRKKYVKLIKKGKMESSKFKRITKKLISTDEANTQRMKEIIKEYGWPNLERVGKKGSNAAWLLVQHADKDPLFQIECLDILKEEMDGRRIDPVNYAFLYDRVQLAKGEKQKYATQSTNNKFTKASFFQAIEEEHNVQLRRSKVGFDLHVTEYAKRNGFVYKVPSKEKALEKEAQYQLLYQTNIQEANKAFQNEKYETAYEFYTKASYCDGYMITEDYVQTARAVAMAYPENTKRAIYHLKKAALRGWNELEAIDDPSLSAVKAENPADWNEIKRIVNELSNYSK